MDKKDKIDLVEGLMWGSFIGLCLCIGVLFLFPNVSAIELDLNKTQSCALFNYTGIQCDSFWCVSGLKGNWTADELCILNSTANISNHTIIMNYSMNETWLENFVLNKSFNVIEQSELVNASTLIAVKNSILDGEENRTREMVLSYVGKYDDETPREPIPPGLIIGVIIILAVVIVAITWINSKKKKDEESIELDELMSSKPKKPYKKLPHGFSSRPTKEAVKVFEKTGEPPENEEDTEETEEDN